MSSGIGVLDEKVAIVTELGRATAELPSEHGAKVVIDDLDADLTAQAAGEVAGETAVCGGDLTKPDAPEALVRTALDVFAAPIPPAGAWRYSA